MILYNFTFRSRGRGLVTKSNIEISKVILQQEKVVNNINPSITQEIKIDNTEIHCDKENDSNKLSISLDALAPLSANCNTGYDSDSSKPVKVKSRWRRSSELEMGRSSTGFGSSLTGAVSMLRSSTASSSIELVHHTPFNIGEPISSESTSSKYSITSTNVKICTEAEQMKESLVTLNNLSSASTVIQIPKVIGAKISLPTVLEVEDREMEERLSQFEHIRENLYLTDR